MADTQAPDVDTVLERRQMASTYWGAAQSRFNTLIDVYHGNYHLLWPGEFRRGEIPKVANWIKLAWDRYGKMVGKVPTTHVNPSKVSRVSQSRADKIEKILAHYDSSSGSSKVLRRYAWNLVGLGAGVIGVTPSKTLEGPQFFWKDPRSVLPAPGIGSVSSTPSSMGMLTKPDMDIHSIAWVIFDEVVTGSYLLDTYPEHATRLMQMMESKNTITSPHKLVTYMDKDWWCVVVNNKMLFQVQLSMGFVPVRYTTMYIPDQIGGQSQFEQNIGLVLAYMKTLNQKLLYNENVTWPWLVLKGMAVDTDSTNRTIQIMDDRGDAAFLSPPGELQAERDLETLDRLIRIMNEDTEALRGEAPGSTVTGAGLSQLGRTVTNTVQDYWEEMTPDLEFLKSAALMIDEDFYGGKKKTMFGRSKGEQFEEEYIPLKDIKGHHAVAVDFGIGVGGFDGFVELMQLAAQGFVDEQTVMENSPFIRSVSDTRRRVFLDRLEKLMFELTPQIGIAIPPQVLNHLLDWHAAVNKGKDPWEWAQKNPFEMPPPPGAEQMGGAPPGMGSPPMPPGMPSQGQGGAPPQIPQAPSPAQILALNQGQAAQPGRP